MATNAGGAQEAEVQRLQGIVRERDAQIARLQADASQRVAASSRQEAAPADGVVQLLAVLNKLQTTVDGLTTAQQATFGVLESVLAQLQNIKMIGAQATEVRHSVAALDQLVGQLGRLAGILWPAPPP